MSLRNSLRQPFPYNSSIKGKILMAILFGLFITVFLVIFQPFGLDLFPAGRLLWTSAFYGGITFICLFTMTALMQMLFPDAFNETVWTGTRQVIFTAFIIFVVGLVNFLVSPLLVDTTRTLAQALWFQGVTMAIGLPPVVIFILLRQNQLLLKFRDEATVIEEKLKEKLHNQKDGPELPSPGVKLLLLGANRSDKLELFVDDVYLITSANNYIKVYYRKNDRVIYSVLRSTIAKTEEITSGFPNFFKCHRAFVINLDKVIHVEGNAQGYKLRIEDYEDMVPVSRNLSAEFSDKLLAHRQQVDPFSDAS